MGRSGYAEPMVAWIIRVVRLLIVLGSRHRSLALENLALRQQLGLYQRTRPKPMMRWSDRLFWIGLRAAWRDWKSAVPTEYSEHVVVRRVAPLTTATAPEQDRPATLHIPVLGHLPSFTVQV